MFENIRFPLAFWMAFMNLSVANEIILSSMGRGSLVLFLGLIGSWIGQVPCVFFAVYWKKDITSLYIGSTLGYFLLCALQLYYIFTSDWELFAQEALKRVSKKDEDFDKVNQTDDDDEKPNTI
jgi:Na+-driven multidrug efflux pump